jgi:hypothetical protein
MRTLSLSLAACLATSALTRDAEAAPPWVERHLTMPAGDVAFDLGAAIETPPPRAGVPVGANLELGIGLTSRIELGFRTGLRFGDPLARGDEPDAYARLFDLQTFDGGAGPVANPEVRLRGALVRGEVGEVALEGRAVLPFEDGTGVGVMLGVPIALHFGDRVRLDTGAYVPLVFPPRHAAEFAVRIPLDLWIQATPRFWIGPMAALTPRVTEDPFQRGAPPGGILFGLGLGYQIARAVDFKAMVLLPHAFDDNLAAGVGLQFRIE